MSVYVRICTTGYLIAVVAAVLLTRGTSAECLNSTNNTEGCICVNGYWGLDCSSPCGHCRAIACNQNTSVCLEGNGTGGNETSSICQDGFWSPECDLSCDNCVNGCDVASGECEGGCVEGMFGAWCNETCGACTSQRCDQFSGNCTGIDTGCMDSARWGSDCKQPCPPRCEDGCVQQTGVCVSCKAHEFHGDRCELSCRDGCLSGICNMTGNCMEKDVVINVRIVMSFLRDMAAQITSSIFAAVNSQVASMMANVQPNKTQTIEEFKTNINVKKNTVSHTTPDA